MDNLNNIPQSGSWSDISGKVNDNFLKTKNAITVLENSVVTNKGYWTSLSSLEAAYPTPQPGWQAYVADAASSTGYYIATVSSDAWVVGTIEAPGVEVNFIIGISNDSWFNSIVDEIYLVNTSINRVSIAVAYFSGGVYNNFIRLYTGDTLVVTALLETFPTESEAISSWAEKKVFNNANIQILFNPSNVSKGNALVQDFNHPLTLQYAPNLRNLLQDEEIAVNAEKTKNSLGLLSGGITKDSFLLNSTVKNIKSDIVAVAGFSQEIIFNFPNPTPIAITLYIRRIDNGVTNTLATFTIPADTSDYTYVFTPDANYDDIYIVAATATVQNIVGSLSIRWDENVADKLTVGINGSEFGNLVTDETLVKKFVNTTTGGISANNNAVAVEVEAKPDTLYYIQRQRDRVSADCGIVLQQDDETYAKPLTLAGGEIATFRLQNNNNGFFRTTPTTNKIIATLIYNVNERPFIKNDNWLVEVPGNSSMNTPLGKKVVKSDNLQNSLKVLLVGSSFGVNAISMFPVLAHHAGIDITVGNLYSGSASIGKVVVSGEEKPHIPTMFEENTDFGWYKKFQNGKWWGTTDAGNRTMSYALKDEKWDVIIFQRSASELGGVANPAVWTAEQTGYLQDMVDFVRQNSDYNPKILFNDGFANPIGYSGQTRETQLLQTQSIIDSAETMRENFFLDVIPLAAALQNARSTYLKNYGYNADKDIAADIQHLDTGIGYYIPACVMFEYFLKARGLSVLNLNYLPVYSDISACTINVGEEYFTTITEANSIVSKYCAMAAIAYPDIVSEELAIRFP